VVGVLIGGRLLAISFYYGASYFGFLAMTAVVVAFCIRYERLGDESPLKDRETASAVPIEEEVRLRLKAFSFTHPSTRSLSSFLEMRKFSGIRKTE